MRGGILAALIICALAEVACAELRFDKIAFDGAQVFSTAELARWLNVPTKQFVNEDSVAIRIHALEDSLVERDYLFARVDSFQVVDRGKRRELRVFLNEGRLAKITTLRWLGDSTRVLVTVSSRAMTRAGSTFHWSNLTFDAGLLLDYFETSGYPFARVEISRVEPDSVSGGVSIWLQIASGPLTRIDFISFAGNRQTRESFLLRETRLHEGELYNQRRLTAAQRSLRRLEFVRQAFTPALTVNEAGETGVRFGIEESRSTLIDVVAGYQPAVGDRAGQVSGLANLDFLNLFGAGRKGHLHWERPTSNSQTVEIAYTEPWVLKQPVSLRIDFRQRIQDTLFVERAFGLQVGFAVASQLSTWATARREAVYADSASSALYGLPDSRTTYLEVGLSFDTRDEPLNPRRGVLFSSFAGSGWRDRDEVQPEAVTRKYRQRRGGVDSEVAHEFLPFWILAVGVHARALNSTEPEILLPDLYRLGGARTLRGYREEQFFGSRIGWASTEIRYWLGPLSRVFLFMDAGGIYREQLVDNVRGRTTLYRAAAGLGLRLETNMGVWGIDYGVGEGDRLLDGKLHVSLLSSF